MRRLVIVAVVLIAVFVAIWVRSPGASQAAGGYAPAHQIFTMTDPAIIESSGVAVSSYDPRVIFTHNDSGDSPRFFAVGPNGSTLTTFNVAGASAVDWEDMARGRSSTGNGQSVYLADIGNNAHNRVVVTVYEVAEPVVNPDSAQPPTRTLSLVATRKLTWPLKLANDAETLLVAPDGTLYIVSKIQTGQSNVYRAVGGNLVRIATINLLKLQPPKLPVARAVDIIYGGWQATGGAINATGTKLVVRTYVDAFEWTIPNGDVAAAFASAPRRVTLPNVSQGEGITYTAAGDLLVTTEGANSPVYVLAAA